MILVTGGTGFVGRDVVRTLRTRGLPARLLVRHPGKARKLFPDPGIELAQGDVRNAASLESALEGVSAVIHLVGIISERRQASFETMHTQATWNVVTAMQRAGVTRLVHMSALGTRPHARSRYHQTKWDAEEIVRASGLAWTIFRPSIVYGPQDHFVNLFATLASWPMDLLQLYSLPLLGSGESKLQPIAVDQVSHAFVSALSDGRSVGQTLDLCGPEAVSFRVLMETICQTLGHETEFDPWVAKLLLRHAVWALTFYVFLFALVLFLLGKLTLPWTVGLLALGLSGSIVVRQWRTMLLFPIPQPLLTAAGYGLDLLLPDFIRGWIESWTQVPVPSLSQMQMLEEDNVGNPEPAARLFRFTPRPFAEGVAYLKH
jgi:NADH dehydrogenase